MATAAFVAAAGPTGAFASLPFPSPHDEITREAAKAAGWPGRPDVLLEAVRAPDLSEMRLEPTPDDPARVDAKDSYDPAHHCDRVPPTSSADAFDATVDYVQAKRMEARANTSDPAKAIAALGAALHAAQDCFSHSDYVDLSSAQQAAFRDALTGGPARPTTRLTAFAPDDEDPGAPDDPYPHDAFAKDSPDANAEAGRAIGDRTAYDVARAAAIETSTLLIAEYIAALSPDERRQHEEYGQRNPLGLPGAPLLLVLGLMAAATVACCRRAKR